MEKITMEMARKLANKLYDASDMNDYNKDLVDDSIKVWDKAGLIEEVDYEQEANSLKIEGDLEYVSKKFKLASDAYKNSIGIYKKAITQLKEKHKKEIEDVGKYKWMYESLSRMVKGGKQ